MGVSNRARRRNIWHYKEKIITSNNNYKTSWLIITLVTWEWITLQTWSQDSKEPTPMLAALRNWPKWCSSIIKNLNQVLLTMAPCFKASIWLTKACLWEQSQCKITTKDLTWRTVPNQARARERANGGRRTMSMAEISSANSVTRRILAIPPYIPTWNRSIPKALMERSELLLPADGAEEDPAKM